VVRTALLTQSGRRAIAKIASSADKAGDIKLNGGFSWRRIDAALSLLRRLAKFLGRGLGYPKRFPRGIGPRLVRGQYSSGSRFE
jgi:hypothetical protein